ncbi:MAG TPA: hypothetical protein PKE68_14585, partial [Saprospiraceae bacterium]|nr:hypothetical protein [Saprospiraceae bacterium]
IGLGHRHRQDDRGVGMGSGYKMCIRLAHSLMIGTRKNKTKIQAFWIISNFSKVTESDCFSVTS